jgi:hypothetical protein
MYCRWYRGLLNKIWDVVVSFQARCEGCGAEMTRSFQRSCTHSLVMNGEIDSGPGLTQEGSVEGTKVVVGWGVRGRTAANINSAGSVIS